MIGIGPLIGDTLRAMYKSAISIADRDNQLVYFAFEGKEHIVVPGDTVEEKLRLFELYGAPDPVEMRQTKKARLTAECEALGITVDQAREGLRRTEEYLRTRVKR